MILAPTSRQMKAAGSSGQSKGRRLAFGALALSVACALAAFVFLILRDKAVLDVIAREIPQSVLTVYRSLPAETARPAAPSLKAGTNTPPVRNPSKASRRIEFSLALSNKAQAVGPLKLRLARTDARRHSYNLVVVSGERAISHRNVKTNEPLSIVTSLGAAPIKLVATAVEQRGIAGYIVQSGRPGNESQIVGQTRR